MRGKAHFGWVGYFVGHSEGRLNQFAMNVIGSTTGRLIDSHRRIVDVGAMCQLLDLLHLTGLFLMLHATRSCKFATVGLL